MARNERGPSHAVLLRPLQNLTYKTLIICNYILPTNTIGPTNRPAVTTHFATTVDPRLATSQTVCDKMATK